jgi:putative glutamine amidotransferase
VEPGSRPTPDVSCHHHQCVATLGEGLVAVAHAADGVVEAVEIPGAPAWFLGVQWHPEDTWEQDGSVFAALVRASMMA